MRRYKDFIKGMFIAGTFITAIYLPWPWDLLCGLVGVLLMMINDHYDKRTTRS